MKPRCARNRRSGGFTLIEMLVSMLIMTVLGVGLWTLVRSTYDSQYIILGQNTANANARQAVDELADDLRGAKGLTAASAAAITYTDNSSNSVRYWLNNGNLVMSTNGLPSVGTAVVKNVSSLAFTYWTYANGNWSSSSAPATPANVKAVDFAVTATVNGTVRRIAGSVRIRQK